VKFSAALIGLCACGARTELAGIVDAGAETSSGCHDEIISSDAKGAGWLALDGSDVFWGTSDGLVRVHDASGNKTLASEGDAITGLAVDSQYVYYAITGLIRRVARAGGPTEDVFTNAGIPSGIALVGSDVIWLDYGQGIAAGSVRKNGTPIVSMLDTPGGIAVDGAYVFVTTTLALIDQKGVPGPLLRANLDGSDLTVLVQGLHEPGGVKTFGGRVYYIEQVDATSTEHGGVRSIDENGGTPTIEVTTDNYLPIDFTVDSSGVYVTATGLLPQQPQDQSTLFRGTTALAQDVGLFYQAVRTDDVAVYWTIGWVNTTPSGGATVRKICK
jgi:hypothetical protein